MYKRQEKDKIEYRGTINKIIFDGYYKVFKEDEDLPIGDFPEIKEGDKFTLNKLDIKEDYTKPPARLTESSLVKTLEAEGIGRPSTYASIIDTLKKREYVELQNKWPFPHGHGIPSTHDRHSGHSCRRPWHDGSAS